MKALHFIFIFTFTLITQAQDILDTFAFSENNIQGTARFRALSGAFGALGGDLSAVNLNPAGSSIFTNTQISLTGASLTKENNTQYFGEQTNTSITDFDLNQAGIVFTFTPNNNSSWKRIALSIVYDRTKNNNDFFVARGINGNGGNGNSISNYFLNYANLFDPVRLADISFLNENETITEAYSDIGRSFGFVHQQAFLGFQAFIINPDSDDDDNTLYLSNVGDGDFEQDYTYNATGFNGKAGFNISGQYNDNLHVGINLNSHVINFQKQTRLIEINDNGGSIEQIDFENVLSTKGNGFSFQLGGIYKVPQSGLRIGATYKSPTWYTLREESIQGLETIRDGGTRTTVAPNFINIFPSYRLRTPSELTSSLAYIFGKRGLLSFDYNTANYSAIKYAPILDYEGLNETVGNAFTRASTYRFGGEYRHKEFSFRGGYRFEESPYEDGVTIGDLNGYSLGIGYDFGNTRLDISYDASKRSFRTPLYTEGLTDSADIEQKQSNILLSLVFNL